jgi:hypothetical protein
MNMVYLYGRGNPKNQITAGQLGFDDGNFVSFGPINDDGSSPAL